MATSEIVCLDDFEKHAFKTLPLNALDYFRSGANDQVTLTDNVQAFRRFRLIPRVMRDVSGRDLSTTVLGHRISFPVCIAPTAMNRMAHPEGEVASAKGAAAADTAFVLSTISTSSVEEVAEATPNSTRFFQMYIYKERNVTLQLLRRAERAGFKAIMLTVDTPFFGKRLADNRNRFKLPPYLTLANFKGLDFTSKGMSSSKKESGLNEYSNSLFDQTLTWDDVRWLRSVTKLPIIIKGVLSAKDAVLGVEAGIDGILVSNHGARQLDGVPATIDVLEDIVKAVAGRCEVYLDGGVRTGTDVFKALALGARAVFLGRPAIYALSYNGAEGVTQMLELLKKEFDTAMALAGCTSVKDIDRDIVVHQSQYLSRL